MTKQRGRPKLYDANAALEAAGAVFWSKGFSATSLDDLANAMAMNRPSIYRAFGDKEAIYRQALARFSDHMEEGFKRTLLQEPDIRVGLRKFYREALEIYTSGDAKTLAQLIQAVLHSLAIRARAGESKTALRKFADASIATIVA